MFFFCFNKIRIKIFQSPISFIYTKLSSFIVTAMKGETTANQKLGSIMLVLLMQTRPGHFLAMSINNLLAKQPILLGPVWPSLNSPKRPLQEVEKLARRRKVECSLRSMSLQNFIINGSLCIYFCCSKIQVNAPSSTGFDFQSAQQTANFIQVMLGYEAYRY